MFFCILMKTIDKFCSVRCNRVSPGLTQREGDCSLSSHSRSGFKSTRQHCLPSKCVLGKKKDTQTKKQMNLLPYIKAFTKFANKNISKTNFRNSKTKIKDTTVFCTFRLRLVLVHLCSKASFKRVDFN